MIIAASTEKPERPYWAWADLSRPGPTMLVEGGARRSSKPFIYKHEGNHGGFYASPPHMKIHRDTKLTRDVVGSSAALDGINRTFVWRSVKS